MKKAIVFGGGGSRGSYELGVWTSLIENKIDYKIVTGTSIGSLNGALMTQKDYDLACSVWNNITVNNVMENGINLENSIEAMFNHKDKIIPFFKKYITNKGADIKPLKDLLNRVINEEHVQSSDIDFGLVTVSFPNLKPYELKKSEIKPGKLHSFLLASASCFPAFPMCKIDDKLYIDGGYYDNLPINFAFKIGADEVIAVDLKFTPTHNEYINHPLVTYIKPSWDLGSFLLFKQDIINNNNTLGYNDAQKALGRFFGFRYTFFNNGETNLYEKESQKLVHTITKLEAGLSDSMRIAILKLSLSPITDRITEYTNGKHLTSFDYLVRSLEIIAELLNINHLKVYHFRDFINYLIGPLNETKGMDYQYLIHRLQNLNLSSDLPVAVNQFDKRRLLSCLYQHLSKDQIILKDLSFLASTIPKELIAVLGLIIIKNN